MIAFLAVAGPLSAQEYVALPNQVEPEVFYRAVACAAPPGGACSKPFLRWPAEQRRPLSVGFGTLSPALHAYQLRLYERGLAQAIAEINALEADIWLELDPSAPQIAINVVDAKPGQTLENTDLPLFEGAEMSLGLVAVRANVRGQIKEASIAISATAGRQAIASVILEELVQSLGLITDIRSSAPAYRRSVFSEDSNSGTRLDGQDAAAILMHYPPREGSSQ